MTAVTTSALVLKKLLEGDKILKSYQIINDFKCPIAEKDDIVVKVHACSLTEEEILAWQVHQAADVGIFPVGREISGTITEVGKAVKRLKVGDEVVGIIPPDVNSPGCAKFCVLSQYDVVIKPADVSHGNAVCVIKDAVKAYTALHYLTRISSGDILLICNAASGFGLTLIQLAHNIRVKVIATENNDEGLNFLRRHQKPDGVVVDTRLQKRSLVDVCMDESGGLGVDCVIDNGVEMYTNSVDESRDDLICFEDNITSKPHKHDIISSLAVGGRWVTTQSDLQLDPPDSQLLFLKCASLHFLFEDSWMLSKSSQGKYLHILEDIIDKLRNGVLRPLEYETIPFDECPNALEALKNNTIKKTIVQIT